MYLGILKELLDRNLITDADVEPLRNFVLGMGQAPPRLSPAKPQVASTPPTLSLPAGVSASSAEASEGLVQQTTATHPLARSAPAAAGEDELTETSNSKLPASPDPAAPDGEAHRGGVKQWKPVKSAHQKSG
jgi:hypothetical protein